MNRELGEPGDKAWPHSTHEIKKQLADFEIVRTLAESYGTPDFASQVGLQSIRLHLSRTAQEL